MTYTNQENANDYLGFTDVSEAEVNQAERDLDDLALGAHGERQNAAPYRKLDPLNLDEYKADGLERACCEQIRYRRLMGSEFFARPQRKSGEAENVKFDGTLPHVAPRALAILSDVGLVNRLGSGSTTNNNASLEDIGWNLV